MSIVRVGLIAALLLWADAAHAEPFEASGFVGVGWFSERTELGNSWAPEQVPNTAPVLGARLGWLAVPALVEAGTLKLQLAVEAELAIATAFTGSGDTGRMSYFAPVFGWRAHALVRFAGNARVRPHLAIGAGGETVASSSPYMSKETDAVGYWGAGVAIPVTDRWLVRADLRHGIMAARDAGMTSTVELQLGVVATFGAPVKRVPPPPPREPEPRVEVVATAPILPSAPPDPDGDGFLGAADRCPDAAEDVDGFEDDDGCPDLDNDGDGFPDTTDACPLQPETTNGFTDADGCPDTIPDDVTAALAIDVKFEPGRARLTAAATTALQPLLAMLSARELRITITGHGADLELAKRRAEAVKWFLVDAGITEARIETRSDKPGKATLELKLSHNYVESNRLK